MSQISIDKLITQETEKRLAAMQDPSYRFPKEMTGGDTAAILISIAVCLGLIVCCMTGVIV